MPSFVRLDNWIGRALDKNETWGNEWVCVLSMGHCQVTLNADASGVTFQQLVCQKASTINRHSYRDTLHTVTCCVPSIGIDCIAYVSKIRFDFVEGVPVNFGEVTNSFAPHLTMLCAETLIVENCINNAAIISRQVNII
jgi:hypothetical protein